MPAIMSPNPKRVRVFLKGGQLYEGGIEENMGQAFNLGRRGNNTPAEGTPGGTKKEEK